MKGTLEEYNVNCNKQKSNSYDKIIELGNKNKKLKYKTDILGRKIQTDENKLLFYIYNDGSVDKKIIIK